MTTPELFAVLILVFGIAGCSQGLTSGQEDSVPNQAISPSGETGTTSSRPSTAAGQARRYFTNPQARALAETLEHNDWAAAEKAVALVQM